MASKLLAGHKLAVLDLLKKLVMALNLHESYDTERV
jgi:hypothetical protein